MRQIMFPDSPGWGRMLIAALGVVPATAWAIEVAGDLDLIGLPWARIFGCGILALWGSLARTRHRAKIAKENDERFALLQELWRDARVSSVIGAVVYATAHTRGWNKWELLLAALAAGYAGVTLLDAWVAKIKGGPT